MALYEEDVEALAAEIRYTINKFMVVIRYHFDEGAYSTGANWHNSSIIGVSLEEYREQLKQFGGCNYTGRTHSAFENADDAQRFIDEYIEPKLLMRRMAAGGIAI